MKQILGKKKHKLCEQIGMKKYSVCYVSAKYGHYVAECWINTHDADYVNYDKGYCYPKIRDGQLVTKEQLEHSG